MRPPKNAAASPSDVPIASAQSVAATPTPRLMRRP